MNWRAGAYAVGGAVAGGFIGLGVGHALAPRLRLAQHNGDHDKYAGSALLVGASIGAIVALALASSPDGGSP